MTLGRLSVLGSLAGALAGLLGVIATGSMVLGLGLLVAPVPTLVVYALRPDLADWSLRDALGRARRDPDADAVTDALDGALRPPVPPPPADDGRFFVPGVPRAPPPTHDVTRPLRLLLAPLALAVGACSSPAAPVGSAEDAIDAAHAAAEAGDTGRALDLIDRAAASGDIEALAFRADVYERGYLAVPAGHRSGEPAHHVAFWAWPWEAAGARRDAERALAERVERGVHDALFLLADRLVSGRFVDGRWARPPAERDSARALYRRLAAEGGDPQRLAWLARSLGDPDAWLGHLRDGVAAGDDRACVYLAAFEDHRDRHSAALTSRAIDALEACRAMAPAADRADPFHTFADRTLGTLAREARSGNGDASAALDSLRQLGVLDRHPRLADVADGETDV